MSESESFEMHQRTLVLNMEAGNPSLQCCNVLMGRAAVLLKGEEANNSAGMVVSDVAVLDEIV
jgi:hypothetical protein